MELSSSEKREKMVASGTLFERHVSTMIQATVKCRIFVNYEIFSKRLGRATECDLVVVTSNKIYCIECKNYNGYIVGSRFDEKWRFASSGRKGKVQNPFLLNRKHIRLIRGEFYKLGLRPLEIINVIVVPDNCTITGDRCTVNDKGGLMNLSSLLTMIRMDCQGQPFYSIQSISMFLSKLQC